MQFEKSQDEFGTTYKNENIEVQIANNIENPEEVFASIERDLNIINNFEPIEKLSLVVSDWRQETKRNDSFYCGMDDIKTSEFQKALIHHGLKVYDNWKIEGLYEKIFEVEENLNSSKESADDFASFYQANEFSLFGGRFSPAISSEEEIKNICAVSIDLVNYFLDNGEKEKLIHDEITIEDIKPWAEKYNIDIQYYASIHPNVRDIWVSSTKLSALILDTKKEYNGFWMDIATLDEEYDTPKEIEQMICTFENNIQANRKAIKNQAPNFYKEFEKPLLQVPKIKCIINKNLMYSVYRFGSKTIQLKNLESQMVEYNHFLFQDSFDFYGYLVQRPQWIVEGFDIYLMNTYADKKGIEKLLRDTVDEDYHKSKFAEDVIRSLEVQKKVAEKNVDFERLDEWLSKTENRIKAIHLVNAGGLGFRKQMVLPNFKSDTVYIMQEEKVYHGIDEPNNLNFFAHVSFVTYMVERFGLEKMLYLPIENTKGITFEEYFGKSYKELEADWKQYLIDNIKGGEWLVYGEEGQK